VFPEMFWKGEREECRKRNNCHCEIDETAVYISFTTCFSIVGLQAVLQGNLTCI
jgi:hypothetical protein